MSNKQPFTPIFFGDFLASTAEWEGEERSLYLLLLCYQWTLGNLPAEQIKLAKLIGYDKDNFEKYWVSVAAKFDLVDGRLLNQRLEVHRAKAAEISSKRAAAGANGGKVAQAKFKQMLDQNEANASNLLLHPNQSKPNQSISKEIKTKNIAPMPEGINADIWKDWIVLRKSKKAAVTETAIKGIEREAAKAGITLEQALVICCERGWAGFEASWILKPKSKGEQRQSKNIEASLKFLEMVK
jgi:hypothetical protein